jgi:hypothetical protein
LGELSGVDQRISKWVDTALKKLEKMLTGPFIAHTRPGE